MNTTLRYIAAFLCLCVVMATAQAKDKIEVRFENGTDQTVQFTLNGGGGQMASLDPGQKGTYTMKLEKDVGPEITILEANTKTKEDDTWGPLEDGGNYIFTLKQGIIGFDDKIDHPESAKFKPGTKAPGSKEERGETQLLQICGMLKDAFDSIKSVEKYLGKPNSKEEEEKDEHMGDDEKKYSLQWDDGCSVTLIENPSDSTVVIQRVQLTRKIKGLETACGVGSSRAEVIKLLGKPQDEQDNYQLFRFEKSGLPVEFWYDEAKKVKMWAILEMPKETAQETDAGDDPATLEFRLVSTDVWEPVDGEISYSFFEDGRVHIQGKDGEATMWEGTWTIEDDQLTVVNKTLKKTTTCTVAADADDLLLNGDRFTRFKGEDAGEAPPSTPANPGLAGDYTDGNGGDLTITDASKNKFTFSLSCVRGPSAHTGEVEGEAIVKGNLAVFKAGKDMADSQGKIPQVTFKITGDSITVTAENCSDLGGAGTFFDGTYHKAPNP